MSDVILSLRGFGVAFGPQIVLASIDLDIPTRGIFIIVGPPAAGKSTLLRTLAGLNNPQPALRTWGEALIAGQPLDAPTAPPIAMVLQSARLLACRVFENLVSAIPDRAQRTVPQQIEFLRGELDKLGQSDLIARFDSPAIDLSLEEQRRVTIVRAALTGSPVILVDEPTSGISDENKCNGILALLEKLARDRAVVVTTHHRGHARTLGGKLALIAGGAVQECGETRAFLEAPRTIPGQSWLKTGHCGLPSPGAKPEELAEDAPPPVPVPPETRQKVANAREPSGFFWFIESKLAGMPRPGIVNSLEDDLEGVRSLGVDLIITLEETPPIPADALRAMGIANELFPIPDMNAPGLARAMDFCRRLDVHLANGRVVALHCLAGLGRTGTMLAAYGIWHGASVVEAIDRVRSARPLAIQSEAQALFLEEFAKSLACTHKHTPIHTTQRPIFGRDAKEA